MTLKQQVQQKLKHLSGGAPGPQAFSLQSDKGRLDCAMEEVGAVGCSVLDLSWSSDQLQRASFDQLREAADSLSQRLTYLLEPIRIVEADDSACEVQMRSAPPTVEDDRASYYEVSLGQGAVKLSRWERAKGQRRERIPAQFTTEVLGRLAEDLSDVASAAQPLKKKRSLR